MNKLSVDKEERKRVIKLKKRVKKTLESANKGKVKISLIDKPASQIKTPFS